MSQTGSETPTNVGGCQFQVCQHSFGVFSHLDVKAHSTLVHHGFGFVSLAGALLTCDVTSFALYCVLENRSIKSGISSLLLADALVAVKLLATEGDAAIIAPRPAVVASSRTRPPSKTAEPCPV